MRKIMFNDRYGLTQAVLEGRKTMTRRIILNKTRISLEDLSEYNLYDRLHEELYKKIAMCKYSRYTIGEIVAVAQCYGDCGTWFFPFDEYGNEAGYTNKMFVKAELMPHQIRITDIGIERLQDISDDDCIREGVVKLCDSYRTTASDKFFHTAQEAFAALIDKVSGKGTWERNPWVFAYTFELVR